MLINRLVLGLLPYSAPASISAAWAILCTTVSGVVQLDLKVETDVEFKATTKYRICVCGG